MLKTTTYKFNLEDMKKILPEVPHFHWNELVYKDQLVDEEAAKEIGEHLKNHLHLEGDFEIRFTPLSQAFEFHSYTACLVELIAEEEL